MYFVVEVAERIDPWKSAYSVVKELFLSLLGCRRLVGSAGGGQFR